MDWYLGLLAEDRGHRVPPEMLAEMADRASALHVDGGTDLTSSVFEVIKGKLLNPAHVARVIEQTNTQAYLKLYDKCPGPERHVHFEGGPARVFDILGAVFGSPDSMKTGADRRKDMASLDYFTAPIKDRPGAVKQAALTEEDVLPDKMGLQKVAQMMAQGSRSPGGHARLYHMVKGAMDKTGADMASLRYQLETGARELVKTAEQAIKEGASAAEVARAMLGNQPDEATVEVVQETLGKIGAAVDPESIPWGREVTPGHPLRVQTERLAKAASALVDKTRIHGELSSQFAEVAQAVRG